MICNSIGRKLFHFKAIRTNLYAHYYCSYLYIVKWFHLLLTLIILFNLNYLLVNSQVVTNIVT